MSRNLTPMQAIDVLNHIGVERLAIHILHQHWRIKNFPMKPRCNVSGSERTSIMNSTSPRELPKWSVFFAEPRDHQFRAFLFPQRPVYSSTAEKPALRQHFPWNNHKMADKCSSWRSTWNIPMSRLELYPISSPRELCSYWLPPQEAYSLYVVFSLCDQIFPGSPDKTVRLEDT